MDGISAKKDIDMFKSFSKVLLEGRSHGYKVLDAAAEIIREIPKHYGDLMGSIILNATLRYITSIVMEQEVSHSSKPIRESSSKFPRYLHELSGIPEAYAMLIFPPSIPYTSYIHTMPDMTVTICYGNAKSSLYKEELTDDEANLVSLLASSEKVSKIEVHKKITEEALQCDETILELLNGNKEALDAYMCFRAGHKLDGEG